MINRIKEVIKKRNHFSLLNNFSRAKDYNGTLSNKINVFFNLCILQFKTIFESTDYTPKSVTLLNYEVTGYSYNTIRHLFVEIFVLKEYLFSSQIINPIIIDCGSNIGMSILFFKNKFPESTIIGIEANPNAFTLLQKNIEANNLQNIELHNIALSSHTGELSFFIDENLGSLTASQNQLRGGKSEQNVKAEKLSNLIQKFSSIDLIKMDIEGSEIEVISDLFISNTLNIANEYIIEYHHNIETDKSKLSDFLAKFEHNGFNYNIKSSYQEKGDTQDVILHFYKSIN